MKRVISLLLFASLPALAADDLSGVWKVDGSIADHPITPTCTLKQTDKQISGSCKLDADHEQNVEGSVNEKQVTWSTIRNMRVRYTPLPIPERWTRAHRSKAQ